MSANQDHPIETADRRVWVMASREVIEQLDRGDSEPLSIRVHMARDGQLEMTFTQYGDEKALIQAWRRMSPRGRTVALDGDSTP